MGFFKDLTAEIDRTPGVRQGERIGAGLGGDISEVLKYAPSKLRPRRNVEERLARLEAETTYWRERASQAEGRVNFLEASVQRIASQFAKAG
jgi:hypothetical protein